VTIYSLVPILDKEEHPYSKGRGEGRERDDLVLEKKNFLELAIDVKYYLRHSEAVEDQISLD
jgi:hypothetical protein